MKDTVATHVSQHPTGYGTSIAAALVAILQSFEVTNFDGTTSAIVVGGVAAVLSLLSPRFES